MSSVYWWLNWKTTQLNLQEKEILVILVLVKQQESFANE